MLSVEHVKALRVLCARLHERCFVSYEEMQLPALSLEYEVKSYRKLGRIEQADFLKL